MRTLRLHLYCYNLHLYCSTSCIAIRDIISSTSIVVNELRALSRTLYCALKMSRVEGLPGGRLFPIPAGWSFRGHWVGVPASGRSGPCVPCSSCVVPLARGECFPFARPSVGGLGLGVLLSILCLYYIMIRMQCQYLFFKFFKKFFAKENKNFY